MQITINGRTYAYGRDRIRYGMVCAMAGRPDCATVVYSTRRNGDRRRKGTMVRGDEIAVEDGMEFNCVVTGCA